ncbi:serine/threonine-protein kinase [Thermococcus sp.]|uniref:serine/threonine-protein kinase n=1 Tax=Thermococcus sp. TaxID=35749 RepID=UPI0025EFE652|nr:serine/threonine-protein kinase [Thermococcus sp.]
MPHRRRTPEEDFLYRLFVAFFLIALLKSLGLVLAFFIFLPFIRKILLETTVPKKPAPPKERIPPKTKTPDMKDFLARGLKVEVPENLIPGATVLLKVGFRNTSKRPVDVEIDLGGFSGIGRISHRRIHLSVGPNEGRHVFVEFIPTKEGSFSVPINVRSGTVRIRKDVALTVKAAGKPVSPEEESAKGTFGTLDELFSRYRSVELIGSGGFGRVYRAVRGDGSVVALKVPHSLNERTGKVFLREISVWFSLRHRNIVRLYDANLYPYPYIEMEYCDGSLENLNVPLNWEQAGRIAFDVTEGLKYAHSKGIIHRDLKPSNILLKGRTPKISDWGLAKLLTETSTNSSAFTPYYAAPEQISKARFGPTDERTDVWQLGVLLYWLTTGRLPFEGEDFIEVVEKITMEEPVPPSEIHPESKPLEPVIMRCLAKRKEERYQSVAELQRDLAGLLGRKYSRELEQSTDFSRSAYYTGELALLNLKLGNTAEALRYLIELKKYAGNHKKELEQLISQLKLAIEEGVELGDDAITRVEILVNEILAGGNLGEVHL